MDKIDAKIIKGICESYIEIFELMIGTEENEWSLLKRAWEGETESFFSGATRRFKTTKELDTYYYRQMVGLVNKIMEEHPTLYQICITKLNKVLYENRGSVGQAGLIYNGNNQYTNTEYYVNYIFAEKALSKAKAILGAYGIK